MELNVSTKQEKIKIALIACLIGFGIAFLTAPFILNQVNGNEVNMIDNYIENVKNDICKTLINASQYKEYMSL